MNLNGTRPLFDEVRQPRKTPCNKMKASVKNCKIQRQEQYRSLRYSPEQAAAVLNQLVNKKCSRQVVCGGHVDNDPPTNHTIKKPSRDRPYSAGIIGNIVNNKQSTQQTEQRRSNGTPKSGQNFQERPATVGKEGSKQYSSEQDSSTPRETLCVINAYHSDRKPLLNVQTKRQSQKQPASESTFYKTQGQGQQPPNKQKFRNNTQTNTKCDHTRKAQTPDSDQGKWNNNVFIHNGLPTVIEVRSLKSPTKLPSVSERSHTPLDNVNHNGIENEERFVPLSRSNDACNLVLNAGDGLPKDCIFEETPLPSSKCESYDNFTPLENTSKSTNQSAQILQRNNLQNGDISSKVQFSKISNNKESMNNEKIYASNKSQNSSPVSKDLSGGEPAKSTHSKPQTFEIANTDTIVIKPGKTTKIEVRPPKTRHSRKDDSQNWLCDSDQSTIIDKTGNENEELHNQILQREPPKMSHGAEDLCKMTYSTYKGNDQLPLQRPSKVDLHKHQNCIKPMTQCTHMMNQHPMPQHQYPVQPIGDLPGKKGLQQYQPQPMLQMYQLQQPYQQVSTIYSKDEYQNTPYYSQYQNPQLTCQQQSSYQWNVPPANNYQNGSGYQMYKPKRDCGYLNEGRNQQLPCVPRPTERYSHNNQYIPFNNVDNQMEMDYNNNADTMVEAKYYNQNYCM